MQVESFSYEKFLLSPGVSVEDISLRDFLCESLKEVYSNMTSTSSNSRQIENMFIGGHPITMDRTNMENIIKDEYLVCEKTDGVRYFLLILTDGRAFLHGRNLVKSKENQFQQELQFFAANLKIPVNFKEKAIGLKIRFLFDGELVLDIYGDKTVIKFLIFDTLISEFRAFHPYKYDDRLEASRKFMSFFKMSKRLIKSNDRIDVKFLPFDALSPKIKLSLKDFFKNDNCEFLFNEYFKNLPHKQDGLIFTKNNAPYKPGKNENILKWKESSQQTIDFLLINNQKFNNPKLYEGKFANRILDLYLIGYNKEFNTSERVLFDFMVVEEENYNSVAKEIEKLRENSDVAICGLIAECKFNKNLENNLVKTVYFASPTNCVDNLMKSGIYRQGDSQRYNQAFGENIQYYIKNNYFGGWEIYGWRKDKSDPNAFETGSNIMVSIRNPIEKEDLINLTKKIPGEHPQKRRKI